jgi:hypothetical protein
LLQTLPTCDHNVVRAGRGPKAVTASRSIKSAESAFCLPDLRQSAAPTVAPVWRIRAIGWLADGSNSPPPSAGGPRNDPSPIPSWDRFSGFATSDANGYLRRMPRKPIELPPAVAHRFVDDMRAFFAEKNAIKHDEIAARQLHVLRNYNPPRAKKLRLSDVHEMFLQMKDHA